MYKSALIAIDINDPAGASHVMDTALALMPSATFHILNVVPDSGMAIVGSMLGPDHSRRMLEEAKTQLESWAAGALPDGADSTLHVVEGTIYDSILKTASTVKADAILIGAHRPELKDYLLGPNAARVAGTRRNLSL